MVELLNSLAEPEARYVPVQGRMRGGWLHIQGRGTSVEGVGRRPYGVSVNISVPPNLAEWIDAQPHTLPSLAGSVGVNYVPMQARVRGEEVVEVHMQAVGSGLNRDYGASFSFTHEEFASFLEATVETAEEEESCCGDECACEDETEYDAHLD